MVDVTIIGAGAAGLMCAATAGQRGRSVLLIDHAKRIGEKIRISGGGRCNFTNLHASPANFLSQNPRFCISALKRYTPQDFIQLVESHGIAYHEKTLGQLFCDESSVQIIEMLRQECEAGGVEIRTNCAIADIRQTDGGFVLTTAGGESIETSALVIATGGPSIPKMGATGWGYTVAEQFGLTLVPPRAALVPFTVEAETLAHMRMLAGVSLEVVTRFGDAQFREGMLFTHRGVSGPAILQISSYWQDGKPVEVDLAPSMDMLTLLKEARQHTPKKEVQTVLA